MGCRRTIIAEARQSIRWNGLEKLVSELMVFPFLFFFFFFLESSSLESTNLDECKPDQCDVTFGTKMMNFLLPQNGLKTKGKSVRVIIETFSTCHANAKCNVKCKVLPLRLRCFVSPVCIV